LNVTYRKAAAADAHLLTRLRLDILKDEGVEMSAEEADGFCSASESYFIKAIQNNSFIAFIAEFNGEAVSTAFMTLSERPPRKPQVPSLYGRIHSVFTYASYRGMGLATRVLTLMIEEAKNRGAGNIDLLATKDGESVYKKLGFFPINLTSMRLELT